MDKKHNINEHSEIKLDVYINYLDAYLSILKNVTWCDAINIFDIFAGQGKSDNGVDGSALRAFRKVLAYNNASQKPIRLFLNDIDPANVEKLKNHIDTNKFPFVYIYNDSADNFISNLKNTTSQHSLVFIDPYGYTKISGSNLDKIFTRKNTDIIMFIPVFHIYKFLRKEDKDEQLAPIAQFLKDMGINEDDIKQPHMNLDKFCELIKDAICCKSNSEFCSFYRISHENKSSEYALYFCSRSLKGLEQFIASLKKVDANHQKAYQLSFFDKAPETYIIEGLSQKSTLTNQDLYRMGVLAGFYSAEINQQLKALEDNNKIVVSALPGCERKRKGFYIGHGKPPMINITLK